jgi:transcriptional regulator with PAS, ATPase and Fis domain
MSVRAAVTEVIFTDDATAPFTSPRAGDPIVALRVLASGRELALPADGRRWVLGSRAPADLVVDDPFVSGVHCILERKLDGGPVIVRDRDSRNGTHVNGIPIEAAILQPGSLIHVGRTAMIAIAEEDGNRRRNALEQLRGRDPVFRAAVERALRAAVTECSVLIVGETGTGKDLIARAIHEGSPRRTGPYVAVNCGAIPRELVGSELFGHQRGAFTGAVIDRDGYFVEASGGTLFLDELAELPIELQPHLLRVVESRSVRRIGGATEKSVDVRIVSATNRLDGLGTPSSRLRVDLYHRVATVVVWLPPLRDRIGDLRELVGAMMADLAPQFGDKQVDPSAWLELARYDWPGNVRELAHAVSRAMALGGDVLGANDFLPGSSAFRPIAVRPRRREHADVAADAPITGGLPVHAALVRDAMIDALARHGSIRTAARSLGMAKSTFADKARAWGILPPKKRGA